MAITEDESDVTALSYSIQLTKFETLSNIMIMSDLLLPFFEADQFLQKEALMIQNAFRIFNYLKAFRSSSLCNSLQY